MSIWHTQALRALDEGEDAVLVSIGTVQGSAPREAGTQMLVTRTRQYGTIGGGVLEYKATARARELLDNGPAQLEDTVILGPDLGQCCGGQVDLVYERLSGTPENIRQRLIANAAPPAPLYIFGAGHVGRALVHVLKDLPFAISWVDSRPESFTHKIRDSVKTMQIKNPSGIIKDAPKDAIFLVLTHDHDLDYDIIRAVLRRGTFRFAGLIGSKTKRARFTHRLAREGINKDVLKRLTCPIGLGGIPGKAPEAIAIAIAAQLLGLKDNTHGI